MRTKSEDDVPFGPKFQRALEAQGWTWEDYVRLCQKHSSEEKLKLVLKENQRRESASQRGSDSYRKPWE
jgi:hypothetical protein